MKTIAVMVVVVFAINLIIFLVRGGVRSKTSSKVHAPNQIGNSDGLSIEPADINPKTGLPIIKGSNIDVAGNQRFHDH